MVKEFFCGFCNGKIIGVCFFNVVIKKGGFNVSIYFVLLLDGEGYGIYIVFIVVGNYGVLVIMNGVNFGKVSGVVLRLCIVVYKVFYCYIGGFIFDVIVVCD